MPEQFSKNKAKCRYIQMNTIHFQLFFSKSFSFSLQTYINMHSLILVLYALRLHKDNWLCTSCILCQGVIISHITSRFFKSTDYFLPYQIWTFYAWLFSTWLILISKVHLERSVCWDAIRHKNWPPNIAHIECLHFTLEKIKPRYFVLGHIFLN